MRRGASHGSTAGAVTNASGTVAPGVADAIGAPPASAPPASAPGGDAAAPAAAPADPTPSLLTAAEASTWWGSGLKGALKADEHTPTHALAAPLGPSRTGQGLLNEPLPRTKSKVSFSMISGTTDAGSNGIGAAGACAEAVGSRADDRANASSSLGPRAMGADGMGGGGRAEAIDNHALYLELQRLGSAVKRIVEEQGRQAQALQHVTSALARQTDALDALAARPNTGGALNGPAEGSACSA